MNQRGAGFCKAISHRFCGRFLIIPCRAWPRLGHGGEMKQTAVDPWRMGENLMAMILATIPAGATVLELGSGAGTETMAQHYNVFSIEHDLAWLGKYESNYIYTPYVSGWYCARMLHGRLPATYEALIIDGPPGDRFPMARYLDLFDLTAAIFIDDINRHDTWLLAQVIATQAGRPLQEFTEDDGRRFGYIPAFVGET